MTLESTLPSLDLAQILNIARSSISTWHNQLGLPYCKYIGNQAHISIKDLLIFIDNKILTSSAPKRWRDYKNKLLAHLNNQNTTKESPTMNTPSILNTLIQLDPGATIPTRAHETDVGYDVKALSVSVYPKGPVEHFLRQAVAFAATNNTQYIPRKILIDTGIHITPPPGYYFELVPNSRLAKTPFSYGNSIGIIDPTYTGSLKVLLNVDQSCTIADLESIKKGTVVGQLILRPLLSTTFTQVDHLTPTDRADGGFGSTAN